MNTEQERAEFERHWRDFYQLGTKLARINGRYHSHIVQRAWEAWQARAALQAQPADKFRRGDRVRKLKGSSWQGRVVGTYSTSLTPEGYAVESDTEHGSVQIYPAAALELVEGQPVEIAEQPADPDAERYRKFVGAGLPITYLGEDYRDKSSLDAAIDATGEP